MVLFAILCFFLAFVVRMRPVVRLRATGLYVRTDIADNGRAKINVASIAESGGGRYSQATLKMDRRCKSRTPVHGARTKWPEGVWYASMRSPPKKADLSAVVSHDKPLLQGAGRGTC